MRTTIEITAEQRSRLLSLAASRNKKGFSELVREALDAYLSANVGDSNKVDLALSMRGALGDDDADDFEETCKNIRDNWR